MTDRPEPMTEADLEALARAAFRGLGLPEEDAALASSVLVLADLFGVTTHGVARIVAYGERMALGGIATRPDIAVERVAPSLIRVDGDNGVGPLVGRRALDAAMEAAAETGMAMALARGSNHFGPIAPYAYLAARKGFATIIGSNATTTIAPWGGRDTRLGNNPMGFGFPRPGGDPIMLDMAMSVAARAKIRKAKDAGQPIPEGWAADADGRPTTDPAEALKGFLLPVGGHKGYGLALMVDMLAGLMSGAAYLTRVSSWSENPERAQDLGHFFIVFDAGRLMPEAELVRRVDDFSAIIHDTPAADPSRPVMLPGEIELASMARQRREGIAIPAELRRKLEALAAAGVS